MVGGTYLVTLVGASLTVGMCGPGCCYVFFSVLAAVSGFVMLRASLGTRVVGLAVLIFSLVQMASEKDTRETWAHRAQQRQIEALQQELARAAAE